MPQLLVFFLGFRRQQFFDIVGPVTGVDDPAIRFEQQRVAAFADRFGLVGFWEMIFAEAAAWFQATLNDFPDQFFAGGVNVLEAALAFCVAAEQDDVHAVHGIDPEVIVVVKPQIADKVRRLLFGGGLAEQPGLLPAVDVADQAVRGLHLRFDPEIKQFIKGTAILLQVAFVFLQGRINMEGRQQCQRAETDRDQQQNQLVLETDHHLSKQ